MERLVVTLKTITPVFLGGADGKTPELRAPSIKGAMRFWWRAMNGDLSIEELRNKECALFGSSDEGVGRSKFALKIICNSNLKTNSYKPVPTKTFTAQAFVPEQDFTLLLTANRRFKEFEMICDVLKVSLLLGGLGKRSRRGFGSLEIGKPVPPQCNSIEDLFKILDLTKPDTFVLNGDKIEKIKPAHVEAEYPYIKEIEIGKAPASWEVLINKIGAAASVHDCYHTGFADPYRFASPIYVSVIKKNNGQCLPIITTLHCAFKESVDNLKNAKKRIDNTQKFKDAIL